MRLVARGAALLLVASWAAVAPAQSIPIALAPGEVLLQVEAEGVHLSRPDLMTVTAGVVTTGASAKEALEANAVLANRLLDAVRAEGAGPRDIQTTQLTVDPRFDEADRERADREQREPRIVGYIARNRLELRLRDLGKAPDIIDGLFSAGANEVRGPGFYMSDPVPARREARRAAVTAAHEEAKTYAEALNMRVARVLRVSERNQFFADDGGTIIVTGSGILPTPIEPGEIETEVRVWIDYALAPQ